MTREARKAPAGAYEAAGRRIAQTTRRHTSILVVSDDAEAAAHTAIGIALSESTNRLVMIGDLAGETRPLQQLVRDDDSHGIYDSFEFGASFVRVAREVPGMRNLFILPSGTESAATEAIISSPRWKSFADEFRDADELLLLVLRHDAPGMADLAANVNGVVLVGLEQLESAPDASVIAAVPHPPVVAPPRIDIAPQRKRSPVIGLALGGVLLLALGIAGGALAKSQLEMRASGVAEAPPQDTVVTPPPPPPAPEILPVNPQDSANATAWSVEILAANTAEGANFEIQRHGSAMPAATISLVPIGDTEATWYKVHAGAYADSAEAGRLLESLRRRGMVSDSIGLIVRVPYALLVDSIPTQGGVRGRARALVQELAGRGVHAYALLQPDGGARIYAGAFDNARQSSLAATALRVAGLEPVLAFRTGRLP